MKIYLHKTFSNIVTGMSSLLFYFQDWHSVVSLEKLVLPKLWRVLKDGGHGSANVIYPNLLPFISHFPIHEMDKTNLYTNFFDNLRKG